MTEPKIRLLILPIKQQGKDRLRVCQHIVDHPERSTLPPTLWGES